MPAVALQMKAVSTSNKDTYVIGHMRCSCCLLISALAVLKENLTELNQIGNLQVGFPVGNSNNGIKTPNGILNTDPNYGKIEALGHCIPPPRHVLPVSRY